MATISLGKRTRVLTLATADRRLVITPAEPMALLIGGAGVSVTTDHQCAQLQPGVTYRWVSSTSARRMSMLSMDPRAPDDPLPVGDPQARRVNVDEEVIVP